MSETYPDFDDDHPSAEAVGRADSKVSDTTDTAPLLRIDVAGIAETDYAAGAAPLVVESAVAPQSVTLGQVAGILGPDWPAGLDPVQAVRQQRD